jgi:DNA-binding CsgD family transcriptional regulator
MRPNFNEALLARTVRVSRAGAARSAELEPPSPGLVEWRASHLLDGLTLALDWLPLAVFALDESGAILFSNRRARSILDAGSGLRESHGHLRCEFSEDSSVLGAAVRRAAALAEGQAPIVVTAGRSQPGRRFELLLLPGAARGIVMGFAHAAEEGSTFSQDLARKLYGLSERESEVASAVVAGRTLEQTAEALDVDKETVRSHLKRVFSKTETSRQAELVRLLSVGLFGLEGER